MWGVMDGTRDMNHEIHQIHEKFLKRYTLDIHAGIIAEVYKKTKMHICCPQIVI